MATLSKLGFVADEYLNTNPFSFTAGAYINASGEIVIAYKGTDFLTAYEGRSWNMAADLLADVGLATTIKNSNVGQQLYASSYFLAVKEWAAENGHADSPISFTGHSLGGGLAANMAVWFNRPATTFAEGPFELGTLDSVAIAAAAATLTFQAGVTASQAILDEISTLAVAYLDYSAREAEVKNYYVQGEFLSYLRAVMPTVVASGNDNVIDIGDQPVSRALALHAMNLHLALLMDDRLKVACKDIPELIPALVDRTLYAADPNFSVQDFVTRLVADQLQGDMTRQDGLLGKFVIDVQKLKGDAGIAMQPEVRTALIAVAMEYYLQKEAINATSIFKIENGALHFKYSDIGADDILYKSRSRLAAAVGGLLSTAEQPYAARLTQQNAWHIQQGSGALVWTADASNTQNDAAIGGVGVDILDAGAGTDILIGGAGTDVLTGGQGDDILMGGFGDDAYLFARGDGSDTIIDADGQGGIAIDGITLAGGKETHPGSGLWKEEIGEQKMQYLLVDEEDGTQTLWIFSGADCITVRNYTNGALGIQLDDSEEDETEPGRTIVGDLRPVGPPHFYDDLGNFLRDPGQPEPGRSDTLADSAGNDLIQSGGGSDRIKAKRGGDDRLYADTEIDLAQAIALGRTQQASGLKGDWLNGSAGDDIVVAGADNDVLFGGAGNDLLMGVPGNDTGTDPSPTLEAWDGNVRATYVVKDFYLEVA